MARWHLATLTEHQVQAIQELERRLGLVLVAYTQDPARAGRAVDWEFGAEWGDGTVLAALNEAYRSDDAADNATPPNRRGYA